ncbi:MAG: iron-sulfur cluster assembly scaffold protein [Pseudomonadota bacterium]
MESDLIKLYSTRILALAADIPHLGELQAPMAQARERSPQCGSVVTVSLDIEDGRVSRFAQDVKACALGQAAASVLGGAVIGRSFAEIRQARDELQALLQDGPTPSAPFEGFETLRAAVPFENRHASIMLAVSATLRAMEEADAAACA